VCVLICFFKEQLSLREAKQILQECVFFSLMLIYLPSQKGHLNKRSWVQFAKLWLIKCSHMFIDTIYGWKTTITKIIFKKCHSFVGHLLVQMFSLYYIRSLTYFTQTWFLVLLQCLVPYISKQTSYWSMFTAFWKLLGICTLMFAFIVLPLVWKLTLLSFCCFNKTLLFFKSIFIQWHQLEHSNFRFLH